MGSLDDALVNGKVPAASRALTTRALQCSNELCEYHKKDAIFTQETLVCIVYDVLRPGQFAPVMAGMRSACRGCGWIMVMEQGKAKPFTVPPEEDPDFKGGQK